jgi:Cdc6-like AAA superfamily ATPase
MRKLGKKTLDEEINDFYNKVDEEKLKNMSQDGKVNNKYAGYVEVATGVYTPSPNFTLKPRLNSGSYKLHINNKGEILISSFNLVSDEILDIPSPEFQLVKNEIGKFLMPDTQGKFINLGYLYKRSFMLHGPAGVGKTVIVNRVAQDVIRNGGVVLFNPSPEVLAHAFEAIDIDDNRLTMVIFEEFDELLEDSEDTLLSLLDGEIQKNNVVYCATTNHFDRVPKRLIRPSRFSTIVKVGSPNLECRIHYLNNKLKDEVKAETIAKLTEGFTIDELKEVVLMTECFEYDINLSLKRIKASRESEAPETAPATMRGVRLF